MNINIPDKIPKLFVLLGILMMGFSYFNHDQIEKNYFNKIDQYSNSNDSTQIGFIILKNEEEKIKKSSENLSLQYDVVNPISKKDSSIVFTRIIRGKENEMLVSDSINTLWTNYSNKKFRQEILIKKDELLGEKLKEEKSLRETYDDQNDQLRMIGYIFFIMGFIGWLFDEPDSEKKIIIKQNDKLYEFCQSCGKIFSSMRKYGTEVDNSPNYAFCIECYEQGKFTNPLLTKEEFLASRMEVHKKRNWLVKKIIKNRIGNLERWNQV